MFALLPFRPSCLWKLSEKVVTDRLVYLVVSWVFPAQNINSKFLFYFGIFLCYIGYMWSTIIKQNQNQNQSPKQQAFPHLHDIMRFQNTGDKQKTLKSSKEEEENDLSVGNLSPNYIKRFNNVGKQTKRRKTLNRVEGLVYQATGW